MRGDHHSLCKGFLILSLLFAVSLCSADDKTFEVVGMGECADCDETTKFKTSQAFSGLHVTVDCKLENGETKRIGVAELDKQGKFKVSLPQSLVENGDKLKQECYAQLHSAAAVACPAHNGLDATKIVFKSHSNGKSTFGPIKNLQFSTSFCTSKFFWPYFNYPPLPKTHPWKKSFPKLPLPPSKNFGHPWLLPPVPIYKPKPPVVVKPLPPPVPIYKPKPKPPVVVKPLPPPVPIYKPKPKPPVYKPPVVVKPLPPSVPIYKPKPKPPVYKPPVVVKPLPPPVPIYKPKPKPPVYKPPVVVKPLPPPVPIYGPKPKPPVYKPPVVVKPLPPPVPICNPKPKPPVVVKPLPPPVPIYKPKPEPPVYKPPVVVKPLPPPVPIYKPPIIIKKPLPPPIPTYPFPKKPCPPFSKIPPKYFHHPKLGYFPPIPPSFPGHP